ncbi:MAG: tetratricopeptide repeat protein [Catalinimonas sp.]
MLRTACIGALLLTLLIAWVPTLQAQKKRQRRVASSAYIDRRESEEYFMEGMKQYMLGRYDRAFDQYEKALKLTPENAALHYVSAESLVRLGQFDEATRRAGRALELDDDNAYYYLLLAQLHEKSGRMEEALRVYRQLSTRFPDDGEYYFPLANAYLHFERYDEALNTYEKIQEFYGINEEVIRQKQRIYLRQNRLDEAIAESRKLIDAFPEDPDYVVGLAEMLVANDKPDEATELLQELLNGGEGPPQAHLILANIYRNRGEVERASIQMQQAFSAPELSIDAKIRVLVSYLNQMDDRARRAEALALAEAVTDIHPTDPKAHAMYGDLLKLAGDDRAARDSYVRSTRYGQSNYTVWEQIVNLDVKLQEFDSLVQHTDEALELFPNQAVLWLFAGVGNYSLGKYRKATSTLEQSRRLAGKDSPMRLDIYRMLGDSYQRLEEYEKSDEAYEAALAIDPEYAPVLNNWSYYLSLRGGELDRARTMGERLVAAHPDDATYLDTYGWVLYVAGEYEEALPYLEKAAKNSDNGTVIEHYGDVLYRLGETQAALEQWKRAKAAGGEVTDLLDRKIADQRLYE